MKAVIMAGGEGSRLRPLTSNTPKPMLPVANVPMMQHIVSLCAKYEMTDIVATVQYLSTVIRGYFRDGADLGVNMSYSLEESPLGTAGSVGNAREQLDETFLVISGDALTDFDLSAAVDAHKNSGAVASIVLYRAENPLEFGIVIQRDDGFIDRFLEKPTWGQVFSDTVNTGIYILEPEVFDYIPEGVSVDFGNEVWPALVADGKDIYGHVAEGYWEDVGTIEAYVKAHRDVLDGHVDVTIPGFEVSDGVWLGEDVELGPSVEVEGPAVVGSNCRIADNVRIGEYSVIGDNVVLGDGAAVQRSVLFENAYAGRRVQVQGAIVGRGADLREGSRVEPDAVVGDGAFVGDNAVVNSSVKVYPFKAVESGAMVNTSVVWESSATSSLFGRTGVRGLGNVDMTPAFMVRLAMAWGSTLKRGSLVTASRDVSRVARALKRAFVAGLNATGVHVDDLEIAPIPLTRFYSQQAAGGVSIRSDPDDPATVDVRFFAPDGSDLPESVQRKVERNFAREDFRRAMVDEMGDIFYPPRAQDFYATALVQAVDSEAIRRSKAKVVLDYAFGSASIIMPLVLAPLGADVLALNPFTAERAQTPDVERGGSRVGDLVRTSGSDFGIAFEAGAERLQLFDDLGRRLDQTTTMLVFIRMISEQWPGSKIVLPVSATQHAQRMANAAGCEVIYAPMSAASITDAARAEGVVFAMGDGGVIVPKFQAGFDAIAEFVLLLELLSLHTGRLSEVVDSLPPVHLIHDTVPTPWERKGAVMRTLVEGSDSDSTTLLDGVKISDADGWVLVLPDPDEPVCHIWAEGASEAAAREAAGKYAGKIREVAGEPAG